MEINQIISLTNHCLHLCNSSNMEEVVFSHIVNGDTLVTHDQEIWEQKLAEKGINCSVKRAESVRKKDKIIVDGSSLGKEAAKWEKIWQKQSQAVCVYNLDKLDHSVLGELVKIHDKMVLSHNKIRMFSDKNLEKEINDHDPEVVESLVKRELKNVLISLLLTKPMCGTELVKVLYQKFRVFVSPGMLYPTLHELEKKGLLKYEFALKNKVYSIKEKKQAELLLKNHAQVNSLLAEFLVRA